MTTINPKSLENLNPIKPKWHNTKTVAIRVPIALVDDILDYGRKLDSGELSVNCTVDSGLKLKLKEILGKHKNNVKSYQTKNASGIINDLKALLK
jgi:hypothetical protein